MHSVHLAVLMTSHNRRTRTLSALAALHAQLGLPAHATLGVHLVDAGSTDGTPEAVRLLHPSVEVMSVGADIPRNQALRIASRNSRSGGGGAARTAADRAGRAIGGRTSYGWTTGSNCSRTPSPRCWGQRIRSGTGRSSSGRSAGRTGPRSTRGGADVRSRSWSPAGSAPSRATRTTAAWCCFPGPHTTWSGTPTRCSATGWATTTTGTAPGGPGWTPSSPRHRSASARRGRTPRFAGAGDRGAGGAAPGDLRTGAAAAPVVGVLPAPHLAVGAFADGVPVRADGGPGDDRPVAGVTGMTGAASRPAAARLWPMSWSRSSAAARGSAPVDGEADGGAAGGRRGHGGTAGSGPGLPGGRGGGAFGRGGYGLGPGPG